MGYRKFIIAVVVVICIAGCGESDFLQYPGDADGSDFKFSNITVSPGSDTVACIHGKDSCFVQIIDGQGIVDIDVRHNIGDSYYHDGITTYLRIRPITTGEAHCRLWNVRLGLDTVISITMKDNDDISGRNDDTNSHSLWFTTNLEADTLTLYVDSEEMSFEIKSDNGNTEVVLDDEFIALLQCDQSRWNNGVIEREYHIKARKVGSTVLNISSPEHETVKYYVNVLGRYHTFIEPDIDFDDTYDSVGTKLTRKYPVYEYITEYQYYRIMGSLCKFNLYINYSEAGTVDSYMVDLYEGVEQSELIGYINERYYKTTEYFNGFPVYIKAFNIQDPGISDATIVVIPDVSAYRVTYQKSFSN